MRIKFCLDNLRGRDHSKDLVIDGRKEVEYKGVDWSHLAQDRNQWGVLVNMVMSLRVP
jgi:hypothetical protein